MLRLRDSLLVRPAFDASTTETAVVNCPLLPNSKVWADIFSFIDHPLSLLRLSWVCTEWGRLILSSDEGFVKDTVLSIDRFIRPSKDDCDPQTKIVPTGGKWLNAGIRYHLMQKRLYHEKARLVKDAHFKAPYFHCIPDDFGPIEEVYIHNGRDIAGLNGGPDKIYCRYFDSTFCDGVCILDIKDRTFNYIKTDGYPATIELNKTYIEIKLTNPETRKSTIWKIPQKAIKQPDEDEEQYKIRLEGPKNDNVLLIQENSQDEIVQLVNVNSNGDYWSCDCIFSSDSRLLTRPSLDVFLIINNQSLEVYDCKTSRLVSKKFHGIRYSRQVNLVQTPSQDFQLTDTHLLYYNGSNKSLYLCPLSEICHTGDSCTKYVKWCHALKIDISLVGGTNAHWTIADLDKTTRYIILSCNNDLGVGVIMFDLIKGAISAYHLEVDLLDPLLAIKYKTAFKTKSVIDAYGTRVLNSHDGIWIIDRQGRAVYVMNLRIEVLKKIYSDKTGDGPLPLHSLGKLIEFKSFPDKVPFTRRLKRQIEEKVFQAAV